MTFDGTPSGINAVRIREVKAKHQASGDCKECPEVPFSSTRNSRRIILDDDARVQVLACTFSHESLQDLLVLCEREPELLDIVRTLGSYDSTSLHLVRGESDSDSAGCYDACIIV